MILSDKDIRWRIEEIGSLVIDPYESDNVEPSSVDLRLGSTFKRAEPKTEFHTVDTGIRNDNSIEYVTVKDKIEIKPEDFVLATTKETIHLPDDLAASVLGRSSLGRLGLSVHQTAGYIDPGFQGEITLELSNHGPSPVRLYSDDRICQIVFRQLTSSAERPYGHEKSQYQGQTGPTESGMDFE